MRFLAFCLAVSALAATSVAVISALQSPPAEPTNDQARRRPTPEPQPTARITCERPGYPVQFSLN